MRFDLYAVRNKENGTFGFPFPGTIASMKRDVLSSLEGLTADFVAKFEVRQIAFYIVEDIEPVVSIPFDEQLVFDCAAILAEKADEVSKNDA